MKDEQWSKQLQKIPRNVSTEKRASSHWACLHLKHLVVTFQMYTIDKKKKTEDVE